MEIWVTVCGERRPRDVVAIGRFAPVAAPTQYGSHDRLPPPERLRGHIVANVNAVPRLP
jgi:hypothetical protein